MGNHILLLPQCFQNSFSRSNVKSQDCVVKGFQNSFSESNVKKSGLCFKRLKFMASLTKSAV